MAKDKHRKAAADAAPASAEPIKKQKKKARPDFEFTGRVESINVKGDGPATSHQCLFALVNGKGEHHPYLLDRTDASRYSAMLSVLTAAYARGAKVSIAAKPNGDAPRIAIELEIRG